MTPIESLHAAVLRGDAKSARAVTEEALRAGENALRLVTEGMVPAMDEAGRRFECSEFFVPELLLAARAMKAALELIRPVLAASGTEPAGRVVVGTVKGDLHDIGKNLVGMMMEGAGFEVIDLGVNTDADTYIAALEQHRPEILGMSALLTTTMPYMKVVLDALTRKEMREDYIVLVGGAPLNEEFGKAVGANAYCRDAATAVEVAKRLVQERRAARA